eukprot:1147651-Pelagomonas_calceolata.AAC.1
MGAHMCFLAAIHQDILIISIHAFYDSQQAHRHANALELSPKSFPKNCIVCLLEINKCCMQPWGCIWALDLSSMLQVPQKRYTFCLITLLLQGMKDILRNQLDYCEECLACLEKLCKWRGIQRTAVQSPFMFLPV